MSSSTVPHDQPTEQATNPPTASRRPPTIPMSGHSKKARPFTALDNPTLSPSYETYDPGFAPSPVPDWAFGGGGGSGAYLQVREDPSDQPEYGARGRGRVGGAVAATAGSSSKPDQSPAAAAAATTAPAAAPASAAGRTRTASDLQDLDAILLESEFSTSTSRSRDWLPDDYDYDDRPPQAMSPKKRRVERVLDMEEAAALDFMATTPGGAMPLELDMEHVDMGCGGVPHHDPAMMMDMHVDHHHSDFHPDLYAPDMHPDLAFSYEEEELPPMPPLTAGRAHMHGGVRLHPAAAYARSRHLQQQQQLRRRHPHHHHQEYFHEMESYPSEVLEHHDVPVVPRQTASSSSAATRSPVTSASSPMASPTQAQAGRRIVSVGGQRRPVRYRQYMNAYVPNVAVPGAYYRRVGYHPRHHHQQHQYARYMTTTTNPANLPHQRVRKAYHLSPVHSAERRGSLHGGPYYMTTTTMADEEPLFSRQHFFSPADAALDAGIIDEFAAGDDLLVQEQLQLQPQQQQDSSTRPREMKRMSLPAIKLNSGSDHSIMEEQQGGEEASNNQKSAGAEEDERKPRAVVKTAPAPPLPVMEEEAAKEDNKDEEVLHFTQREHISLAIPEDVNWLSEFQSYVRLEFLEIFRANHEDVKFRNTSRKVSYQQLGIRCRFCAHVHPGSRSRRSSAYPSSTAQIYQSFNMMIRDHFPRCEHVPKDKMERFHKLKARNNQGAADSKHFWSYAAEKLGMVDSETGIFMDEATQRAALTKSPFSTTSTILAEVRNTPILLVTPGDRNLISPYLFELLSRVQRVNLLDCECRSTRKNLKVGLPGFGCRYCCEAGRLGFSRIFPTKRKGLPEKANDMYEHFRRCTLCPPEVKQRLESLRPKQETGNLSTDKVFFDRVWARLNGGVTPS